MQDLEQIVELIAMEGAAAVGGGLHACGDIGWHRADAFAQ